MTLHVAEGKVELGRDFIIRQFLVMPQLDHDPIMRRQGQERAADLLASFADLGSCFRQLGPVCIPFFIERRLDFSRLEMIQAQVRGDSPDPRTELAGKIEGVKAVIGTYESFLRQVFGFSLLMKQPITNVKYTGLIAYDQFAERVTACGAATGMDDEVAVCRRGHGYSVIQGEG